MSSSSMDRRKSSASDQTRRKIEQMELKREERRILADAKREERKEQTAKLRAVGNTGDVDYTAMVEEWRKNNLPKGSQRHDIVGYLPTSSSKITVAVRKRPMSDKEWNKGDHESATCHHPNVTIHTPKVKVDGIQKSMTHATYQFDYSFGDDSSTDQIYVSTTMPIVDYVLETNKRGTIFAYGQTGSGKTFTMGSIQRILANDLFLRLKEVGMNVDVSVAIFEIYDGSVQDLLNGRHQCKVLEDGKGQVHVTGLKEFPARSPEEFLKIVEDGHSQRTTHATEANDSSSRSHAICQVFLREKVPSKKREKALKGKLTLVDLAGSERGSDTKLHNSQRRAESADINTSLLALKECIRDLGQNKSHVRYRQSELTKILKDSFSADSKTTMIVTISPGSSATDHSLNTCRYAQHLKERKSSKTSPSAQTNTYSSRVSEERLALIMSLCEDQSPARSQPLSQALAHVDVDTSFDVDVTQPDVLEVSNTVTRNSSSTPDKEEDIELASARIELAKCLYAYEESIVEPHSQSLMGHEELENGLQDIFAEFNGGDLSEEDLKRFGDCFEAYILEKEDVINQLEHAMELASCMRM